jgi:hypothetical protein
MELRDAYVDRQRGFKRVFGLLDLSGAEEKEVDRLFLEGPKPQTSDNLAPGAFTSVENVDVSRISRRGTPDRVSTPGYVGGGRPRRGLPRTTGGPFSAESTFGLPPIADAVLSNQSSKSLSESKEILARDMPSLLTPLAAANGFQIQPSQLLRFRCKHELLKDDWVSFSQFREFYRAVAFDAFEDRKARRMQHYCQKYATKERTAFEAAERTKREAISSRMAVNDPSLTAVDLGFNSLGDSGVIRLASLLNGNTSVVSLKLRTNQCGDAGAEALAKMLRSNANDAEKASAAAMADFAEQEKAWAEKEKEDAKRQMEARAKETIKARRAKAKREAEADAARGAIHEKQKEREAKLRCVVRSRPRPAS